MTLEEFILSIIGGGLSYPAAEFLFREFVPATWTSRRKRFAVYGICLLLAVAALALGDWLNYVQLTPDTAFTAFTTAFTTSQFLHAAFGLREREYGT